MMKRAGVKHTYTCINAGLSFVDKDCNAGCRYEIAEGDSSKTTTVRACEWLRAVADMLGEKGRLYGNSIDSPVRIFNRGSKSDGIAARIDDKLARIKADAPGDTEDSVKDLVGYIALWMGCKGDES